MRVPLCRSSDQPKILSDALRIRLRSSGLRASGFTLLEMLLVITLLAATAGLGLATYADEDGSARNAETRRKLSLIEQAIIGVKAPAFGGEVRLSGFVADMGRLPTSMNELLAQVNAKVSPPPMLVSYGLRSLAYDASPEIDGLQTPPLTPLATATTAAMGLRQQVQIGANGKLLDGWGNEFIFNINAAELTITSLGRDDETVEGDEQTLSIKASDWQVSLAAWPISLKNNDAMQHTLQAVLLSHEGLANGAAQWRQRSSIAIAVAAGESHTLSLSQPTAIAVQAPLGRHLLLLMKDNQTIAQRWIDLYPGVLPAPVTLTLSPASPLPSATPAPLTPTFAP